MAKTEKWYVKTGSKNAKNRVFQKSGFSHLGGVWGSKNGGFGGPKRRVLYSKGGPFGVLFGGADGP